VGALGHQVREEIAGLIGSERVEEAFGHERSGQGGEGLDFLAGDLGFVADHIEHRDELRGVLGDETSERLAVFGAEIVEGVLFANAEAGIDDCGQHEVEIVAFVAGEFGADLRAVAVKRVAVRAKALVEHTAVAEIGFGDFITSESAFEVLDQLYFVRRRFAQVAPGCAQLLRQSRIVETLDASGLERGKVGPCDLARSDLF